MLTCAPPNLTAGYDGTGFWALKNDEVNRRRGMNPAACLNAEHAHGSAVRGGD